MHFRNSILQLLAKNYIGTFYCYQYHPNFCFPNIQKLQIPCKIINRKFDLRKKCLEICACNNLCLLMFLDIQRLIEKLLSLVVMFVAENVFMIGLIVKNL